MKETCGKLEINGKINLNSALRVGLTVQIFMKAKTLKREVCSDPIFEIQE
jgi:hypothetical protein